MNTQDILKTLNNLEQSLQNVESARLQVTNTVNAYEEAKSQLHALATEFADVSAELKNVYAAINENVSSIDNTLHDKIEELFCGMTSRVQELDNAVKNIQSAFEAACNQSAQSVENAVDDGLLKLNNEMDVTIAKFNKKATSEIESIATAFTTFKAAAQRMQTDFFNGMNSRAQEQDNAAKNVQLAFEEACNHSAKSVEDAVGDSLLKLDNKMDATVAKFNKNATCELESIATAFATFKAETQRMQTDFSGAVSGTMANIKAVQEGFVTDLSKSVSEHISSFESLNTELKSIIDKYEEINNLLVAQVNDVSDLVKDESASIAFAIQKLQAGQKTEYDDLVARFKSLRDESIKAVDNSLSLVIKNQKETITNTEKILVDEFDSLKGELENSRRLTMFCLIAIIISLILNVIAFIK